MSTFKGNILKCSHLEDQEENGEVTLNLREMGCEDGRWMELAGDHVQWWVLVLAVFNHMILLLSCQLLDDPIEPYFIEPIFPIVSNFIVTERKILEHIFLLYSIQCLIWGICVESTYSATSTEAKYLWFLK
jgi:hypothetical protein